MVASKGSERRLKYIRVEKIQRNLRETRSRQRAKVHPLNTNEQPNTQRRRNITTDKGTRSEQNRTAQHSTARPGPVQLILAQIS